MEYEPSDSSGTDDDLPPPHQNRFQRGGVPAGNGRSAPINSSTLPRMLGDMEMQIHQIEQEAYSSVLRAFKAQSDAITWEKESLITELRKELRVSDEEHRKLLSRVNADDVIKRIREWRTTNGLQPGKLNSDQPMADLVPSPTASASRKKQKTSQGAPTSAIPTGTQPSSSAVRRGPPPGARTTKTKSVSFIICTCPLLSGQSIVLIAALVLKSRSGQVNNRGSLGAFASNENAEAATHEPLIGRKVWTRWPEDNSFYEAVITDYNHAEGRHALVYDINTAHETWEWVNLKEISLEDIRWEREDSVLSRSGARPGHGRGSKKSMTRGGAVAAGGKGRGTTKGQSRKDLPVAHNGSRKQAMGDIEILHTDTLIKEVEKVFGANNPDPMEIEKAKKVLKDHEQSLVDTIARLEDASDGESADGREPYSQGQSMVRV
ncbi:protein EMSY-LIKE 3-like isoform X1 [Cucurbita moschata]|uniref:Protein EMSY-LIKE 3-like isoform X1 n=1 Tax=Cucurbita moschata TaxID=3662 RepID=A0A6J1HCN2_CUCMO|nr:protein EMSY-LIKE 3-like isoform X1 [Cucurbita moschata]